MAVKPGDRLPERAYVITRSDLIRYAGASGDFNPLHWNERHSKSVGLPDVIAHGMYTMALAIRSVTDWLGDAGSIVEYGVRFSKPVPVADGNGTTLKVAATVAEISANGSVILDLTAKVDGDNVLTKCRVVARL
ncbi:MaoC family dehydratase [Mycobacterium sp. NAZ190054]|uniref:MaoC family dehydratase n=1 Tax=Mycobacterium sp. NAZ190054 TaxID=1747766 RepID=UPI000ABEB9D3|nr:MaoC family dehydratase [Mycobacterium sp. NAZ190054]